MFYISSKLNDYVFEVTDTTDGVVEMFTYSELMNFQKQGIKIDGVDGDIVYPFKSKSSPYQGVEVKYLEPYDWIYLKYNIHRKSRIETKTDVFKWDRLNNRLAPVYASGCMMLMEDFEIHRLQSYNSLEDLGKVLFKGSNDFNVCPELTARLNCDLVNRISHESLTIGEVLSRNYGNLNNIYHYNESFRVYVRMDLNNGYDNKYFIGNFSLDDYSEEESDYKLDLCKTVGAYSSVNLKYSSKLLINRILKKNGIFYKVVEGSSTISTISLESIYEELVKCNGTDFKNSAFNNAKLVGSTVLIQACDGVFEYDMDTVFRVYKNITSSESRQMQLKMKLVGSEDKIVVNEKGELITLKCKSDEIQIPSSVNTIKKGSIHILNSDITLFLGSSIKKIEHKSILGFGNKFCIDTNIKDVKVLLQLMKALNNLSFVFKLKGEAVNFKEVYVAYFALYGGTSIACIRRLGLESGEVFENGCAYKIVKLFTKHILNSFKWLDKPIELTELGIKKLPYKINNVTLGNVGSYTKYYDFYFKYYALVNIMIQYMSDIEKELALKEQSDTRNRLDKREKEFYAEVLSCYYYNGYNNRSF